MKKAMKKNENINWDLLAKQLAGETNEAGQEEFSEWLRKSADHQDMYNKIRTTWDQINSMKEMNQFNVDNGWDKLQNRINDASENNCRIR